VGVAGPFNAEKPLHNKRCVKWKGQCFSSVLQTILKIVLFWIYQKLSLLSPQSRRLWGLLGLRPAKQNFMPPKLNYEALYIGGVFIKFQNFKPPELRKSPYRKFSGDGCLPPAKECLSFDVLIN